MPVSLQNYITSQIALGIAVTGTLTVIAIHIPVIGSLCSLFIPLSVFLSRIMLGRKNGAIVPGVIYLLVWLFTHPLNIEQIYIAELLAIGYILGDVAERNLSIEKTFVYTTIGSFGFGIFCLLIFSNAAQKPIITILNDYLALSLEMSIALYRNMGMPEDTILMLTNSLEKIKYVIIRIIPALSLSFILFLIWITLLSAKPICKKKNLFFPDFGDMNLWKAPDYLVWAVIVSGGLLLTPIQSLKLIGINGLIVLMTIYFFGGIAIVSYFFEKKNFPLIIRLFLYTLIALQQIFVFIVIGLGFFDLWINFRKVNNEK